jgi:hypothetical protein
MPPESTTAVRYVKFMLGRCRASDGVETGYVRYTKFGFGHLCVGDDGSVWSCVAQGGRLLKEWRPMSTWRDPNGYIRVTRGHTNCGVHTLVLLAFRGPCPPGMMCRHLNGDKTDNRLENLVWGTAAENNADMVRHGRWHGGRRARLSQEQINEIRAANLSVPGTAQTLADKYGFSKFHIFSIRSRRRCHRLD